ncbi:MAG: EAL domain-containing protein [Thiotrichales bacterium]|nr:EAL domain-containing protein [Thiotrichales bacterium]
MTLLSIALSFLVGLLVAKAWEVFKASPSSPSPVQDSQKQTVAQQYFELNRDIVFAFDEQFNLLHLNGEARTFFQKNTDTASSLNQNQWLESLFNTQQKADFKNNLQTLTPGKLQNKTHLTQTLDVQFDSKMARIELNVIRLEPNLYLAVMKDITQTVQTEEVQEALDISSENFDNIISKNKTGILIVNHAGLVEFANPSAEQLLGRTKHSIIGSYFGTPILSDPSQHSEFDIIREDGTLGVADMSFTNTAWQANPAYLVMMYDITELKTALQKIEEIALHDALTGLPNRRLFNETLQQCIMRHERSNSPFSILFLDLDQFKTINDTLGHQAGDELLVQATQRIQKAIRNTDFMARMGGDEFIILLDNEGTREQIMSVCNKIVAEFDAPFKIQEHSIHIKVSIGIVVYPTDATESDDLLKMADLAMYQAKKMLHKSFHFYHQELLASFAKAQELEEALKKALTQHEFELYYQPQASASELTLTGMEALIRWNHPEKGLVPPMEFIPFLETSGLIVDVGAWVLEACVDQIHTWLAEGYDCPRIAINVCVLQFLDDDFVTKVKNTLDNKEVDAQYLAIEITESIFIENKPKLLEQLKQLQVFGVQIHMDDFGTGYSSLSMIKDIPFDTIKIDQSFVKDLLSNQRERIMVSSIINTIHAYGKTVLVEGVELESQRRILAEEGCDDIQGYLFSRPLQAQDVANQYLSKNTS